jgi:DNA-binding transcriptional LysR family regulator
MEIRQIEVFLAVMEHSTVTLAAQKLHLLARRRQPSAP